MQTSSPSWATIDLTALSHNLAQIKALLDPQTKIMAVVKANAYGHGAVPVSRTLLENGVDLLGVAFVKEAVQLREAGIQAPLVVLSGVIEPGQLPQVARFGLQPFVYTRELARALAAAACRLGQTIKIHIKVDTGMGRLGIFPEDVLDFVCFVSQTKGLEIAGLVSHLAQAEEDETTTLLQLEKFRHVADTLKQAGFELPCLHLANSAAIIKYPDTHFNLVRLGLALYGAYPHPDLQQKVQLKPVLSLKSKIAFLKRLPGGTPLGYGHTYTTTSQSLIATIPIGYADGYSRLLSNRGQALVHGQRAPVVGRICMDFTLLDVTHIPGVQIGDEVTLIGREGEEEITLAEVADWMETIPYEVMCLIGPRVKRIYI